MIYIQKNIYLLNQYRKLIKQTSDKLLNNDGKILAGYIFNPFMDSNNRTINDINSRNKLFNDYEFYYNYVEKNIDFGIENTNASIVYKKKL